MRFCISMAVIYAIIGAFMYGHEFGYEDGKAYQRYVDQNRLTSCQKVIAGNLYAR